MDEDHCKHLGIIGVVGPCGAGKTTLIDALKKYGIVARHIAQEHSYVPYMWKRITNPDILIFLDATYTETKIRRNLNWTLAEYQEQQNRLSDARRNANLIIDTDTLTIDEVLSRVLTFLSSKTK